MLDSLLHWTKTFLLWIFSVYTPVSYNDWQHFIHYLQLGDSRTQRTTPPHNSFELRGSLLIIFLKSSGLFHKGNVLLPVVHVTLLEVDYCQRPFQVGIRFSFTVLSFSNSVGCSMEKLTIAFPTVHSNLGVACEYTEPVSCSDIPGAVTPKSNFHIWKTALETSVLLQYLHHIPKQPCAAFNVCTPQLCSTQPGILSCS